MIDGKYDEKVDIWACGILLYIMLIGHPLFEGDTEEEILNNIRLHKLNLKKNLLINISNDAEDLIKKMLRSDPDDRVTA